MVPAHWDQSVPSATFSPLQRHVTARGRRYLYLVTGSVKEIVTDLSQQLLAEHGRLRGLSRLDVAELALGTAASLSHQRHQIPASPSLAHNGGDFVDISSQ